jgi:hypothetical protein
MATSVTFSAAGLPAWATTLNAQTGVLSGTPAESDVGTTPDIVISVSDGEPPASLPAFHIAISTAVPRPAAAAAPANRAPTISGAGRQRRGDPPMFTPTAADPDGRALTFSIANKPAWASFSTTNGRLSGTPRRRRAHLQQHRHYRFRRIAQRIAAGVLDHRQRGGEPRASHLRRLPPA